MREVIFDTETTGLDPFDGDRIIEIAAIEMINNKLTDNLFHVYINPQRDIPDSAFRVHGLSNEFLNEKPIFIQVVDGFLDFIGDDPLIAHNADFDLKFINEELRRAGRSPLEKNVLIDTLALARRKHPGAPNSLDALCARYGIDRSQRSKHGALIDAKILADIYLELKLGRQKSLSFSSPKEARKIVHIGLLALRTQPLKHEPLSGEAEAHRDYIGIWNGKALWTKYAAPMTGEV